MPATVKICGLTDEKAVRAVIAAKADYAGFVYFPDSPRHVKLEQAAKLKELLPKTIQTVSVLVDPSDSLLTDVKNILNPSYIQLHGRETLKRVQSLKITFAMKIIKAVRVQTGDDVADALRYAGSVDMLMFDAKPPELPGMLPGGNGLAFDWALLKGREFSRPWFLSGGLNPRNVAHAIRATGAKMVDVSSGVESAPGVKDPELIKEFVKAARHEA